MNILCLHSRKLYEENIGRTFFSGYSAIERHPDVKRFLYSGIGWDNYNENRTILDNINVLYSNVEKPDLIILFQPQLYKGVADVDILKCWRLNEMYSTLSGENISRFKIDILMFHHLNELIRFREFKELKDSFLENIPQLVDTNIFKNYKEKKEYDLLLVGFIDREHYPFRYRLKKLMEGKWKSKYNCRVLKHSGYTSENPAKVQVDFSREINKAKIVLTCSSKYKYALSKYVEVPRSYSLLAADLPDERHAFYSSYMLVLDPKDSDSVLEDKLKYYLDNSEEREKLIRKGYDLVTKERNQKVYADSFVSIVKKYF